MKNHQASASASAAAEKKKEINMEEKPLTTPMPPPPPPSALERASSIDTEPKTLLHEELRLAREAALRIINSHSKEEALKIFLAGLVPVGSTSSQTQPVKEDVVVVVSDCDDDDQ